MSETLDEPMDGSGDATYTASRKKKRYHKYPVGTALRSEVQMHGTQGISRRALFMGLGWAAALCVLSTTASVVRAADDKKLKIGIIGSGHVGSALGGAWAKAGNEVMFSSLDLDHDKKLAAEVGANARAGTPQEAAQFGQVVLFAVPYSAFPELPKSLGTSLNGKVVINASNPFPQRDGEIASQAREEGAGLFDARMLPGAFVVRAFNAVAAARMASAHEDPGKIGMPIAGDKRAIDLASRLVREAGFEPVVVGGPEMGKFLMPGTPLAGEHPPDEVRSIAATLKP
jgi:8-hydroxy-5-deazaflavin:NADPH oxidoreductase